ncbi:hypothetical protein LC048_10775 [Mesobacillus subterraneus]|uniref:hypothetical protein n=1 Tax=Mesobacillus subterraneus TaxID=285983 RepID=UPI001CFF0E69|nr:hypothetical protein [Mesobacillus subterraneus]WLR57294.1 hypothetical protein LC048_10775 [Mesobacillus subterraneus]
MADQLVWDLIQRYQYEDSPDKYVEMKHPGLDLLFVHTEKDMNEVFAANGDGVMYVRYHG